MDVSAIHKCKRKSREATDGLLKSTN